MFWNWNNDVLVQLARVQASQNQILLKLNQLLAKETAMTVNVDALTAEVTKNSSVTESVVTLVQNLAAQIAAIPPSTDPTTQKALDQLTQTLQTNDDALAAAVTANTPASGGTAP